ncbi:MAG: hypothetical protein JWM08_2510 [Candidatus Angelobacter sp.]|nr:hypothetical protein [Candidatus Angelobacter sp.]
MAENLGGRDFNLTVVRPALIQCNFCGDYRPGTLNRLVTEGDICAIPMSARNPLEIFEVKSMRQVGIEPLLIEYDQVLS